MTCRIAIKAYGDNVLSFAAAKYARDERDGFAEAYRQIDEALADINRIAERAKATIDDEGWRLPSDVEQPFA